ncbi:MAG: HNH endonuclease [Gemmatimonadetes bacterium]|nr:MAG: HNH endonuclease [Gemmatimonadota bacterium]
MAEDRDAAVRLRAFDFMREQRQRFAETSIPRPILERGFDFEGVRVPLIGPQGIFKPALLSEIPLTITTAPPVEHRERPYDDGFIDGGFLRYRYRGTDPHHRDNVGLRIAMQRQAPLIYLHGIVPGLYEAAWPVFIVEDHPETLTFIVAIDDQVGVAGEWQSSDPAALTARRQYITAVVRRRLHQRSFRQRVLRAYQLCCAVCRLRHDELLEASHILPDGHPRGEPIVPNGLALCKLHHAAFDSYIIGVTPDLEVKVRVDVLEEIDGPMLLHGLQGFEGRKILVPRPDHLKPNRDLLAERYDLFRRAS